MTNSNGRVAVGGRWAAVALAMLNALGCGAVSHGHVSRSTTPAATVVADTIELGEYGNDVAVRADGARAYIATRTGKVLAIDTASRRVAGTITTEGQPAAIALTPDGRRGYVMDLTAQNVFVLDTVNDRLVKRIPVGTIQRAIIPPSVAAARSGTRVYVTNATTKDDHLLVIDTARDTIIGDHFVGIHPASVAVSPDGKLVYVAGCKLACIDGSLLALDADSGAVVFDVPLPSAPKAIALSPDGSRAYLGNPRTSTVGIVYLRTKTVETVATGAEPVDVAVDPHRPYVYVASHGDSRIDVVDMRTGAVIAHVALPDRPRAIALSPDGRLAYVTYSARVASVIDLSQVGQPAQR
jgi:YVTN family beta-propeller protein